MNGRDWTDLLAGEAEAERIMRKRALVRKIKAQGVAEDVAWKIADQTERENRRNVLFMANQVEAR